MKTVGMLLESKGNQVWSVSPDTTVLDALKLMGEKDIGALLILEGGEIAGIFSERDYARKIILKGKRSQETMVSEIMTPNVVCITPSQSINDCMHLVTLKHIRHLPVCSDGKLVGLISIGDIVKEVIAEQKSTITHLEDYITGRR